MNRTGLHISALQHKISPLLLILWLLNGLSVYAQEGNSLPEKKEVAKEQKEELINISGSMQFWLRYTDLNPGSQLFNRERSSATDLTIRRYRLKFSGRANDNLRYTLEFGNNDLTAFNAAGSSPHLLDAYVDYQFSKSLAIGAGKQSWAGPARYSAPSTTQALAYDIDFIAAPFVNVYDDILRRMGVYARGARGGLDYRIVAAKPAFYGNRSTKTIGRDAGFSNREPDFQLSGYIKYQFLEHESQLSPYSPGTYMGKKNILNIGAGALHQPNTTWQLNGNDTVYNTARSLAADLFFEKKMAQNRGLTLYLAWVNHRMGRNFMRYMGANNPSTAASPGEYVNGKGNNAPIVGTGHIWYIQAAYIRPADRENQTQLQPYASMEYSRFQALNGPAVICNAGFHYYMNGHRSKLTFGYQNRPVFKQVEYLVQEASRKNMLVLQYQILFGG